MTELSSREPESMDILYLLDRLEEVLSAGSRMPFTSRTLVDDEECFAVIDQIRLSLPNEIRQARKLNADREVLLRESRARADQILKNAETQARDRAREHQIVRQAGAHAQEIIGQAERSAAQIRHEVDEYAYQVLLDLDRRLEGLESMVRDGLRELESNGETRAPPQSADQVPALDQL
ncbi:MAG: ATPase [Chloroflexi bacterium]|nr:ATPase [Chloroflexota bacterium]